KSGNVFRIIPGVESTVEPAGRSPLEAVENDIRISFPGFLHQPEFITPLVIRPFRVFQFGPGARMARFGARGGIHIPADLYFQMLQGCTETGSKKIIQDIAAVRFRIVYKQPGRTASTHRHHAFEHATFVISVNRYYPAGRILSMESAPGRR